MRTGETVSAKQANRICEESSQWCGVNNGQQREHDLWSGTGNREGGWRVACCVYIKYRQVCERLKIDQESKLIKPRTNLIVAWLGAASCLGISIVGNFQVSNEKLIHAAGAGMCFICGTAYFCMQTWFSYRLKSYLNSAAMMYFRGTMCILSILLCGISLIAANISFHLYKGENKRKWRPEDGGWDAHVVSTVSEWMLSIIFCTFILTYVRDFSYIHLEPPVVRLEIPP
ncbi:unnamed protein product [Timema podura]|uniref:CWH43-like N-terminal domain-containing protein n=1 Tax=Timema podura TaxID=61482 RepID=A0ABN7NG12_TIMPD|nr:unnamed protein product [Timema podura]